MYKKFLLFLLSILIFVSCTSKTEKLQTKKEIKLHKSAALIQNQLAEEKFILNKKLNSYIENMPLEEKITQMFIENLEGCTNFRSYEHFDSITGNPADSKKPVIAGGYLFFSYNLADTPEKQLSFVNSIYTYTDRHNQIYPFLAIDQEGGWVNRLRKLTGGLPSQEKVAATNSVNEAYWLYADQAHKMKEQLGFHMNLAPVMEICSDDNREFLNGRSFGDFNQTIDYGIACVNAYENNQIAAVVKHFPGNTNTDPHTGLPEINLSYDELMASIDSFKRICDFAPGGILMSHARTSAVDSGVPACLSKVWVTDILRNQWGYEGIIFSDDIFMGALAQNGYPPEVASVMAVEAGVNCIMTSEKRFAKQAKVLYDKALEDKAFEEKINTSVKKLLQYKLDCGLFEIN